MCYRLTVADRSRKLSETSTDFSSDRNELNIGSPRESIENPGSLFFIPRSPTTSKMSVSAGLQKQSSVQGNIYQKEEHPLVISSDSLEEKRLVLGRFGIPPHSVNDMDAVMKKVKEMSGNKLLSHSKHTSSFNAMNQKKTQSSVTKPQVKKVEKESSGQSLAGKSKHTKSTSKVAADSKQRKSDSSIRQSSVASVVVPEEETKINLAKSKWSSSLVTAERSFHLRKKGSSHRQMLPRAASREKSVFRASNSDDNIEIPLQDNYNLTSRDCLVGKLETLEEQTKPMDHSSSSSSSEEHVPGQSSKDIKDQGQTNDELHSSSVIESLENSTEDPKRQVSGKDKTLRANTHSQRQKEQPTFTGEQLSPDRWSNISIKPIVQKPNTIVDISPKDLFASSNDAGVNKQGSHLMKIELGTMQNPNTAMFTDNEAMAVALNISEPVRAGEEKSPRIDGSRANSAFYTAFDIRNSTEHTKQQEINILNKLMHTRSGKQKRDRSARKASKVIQEGGTKEHNAEVYSVFFGSSPSTSDANTDIGATSYESVNQRQRKSPGKYCLIGVHLKKYQNMSAIGIQNV